MTSESVTGDTQKYKFHTITFEGTTVTFKAPATFEKMEDEEPMEFAPDDLERFADVKEKDKKYFEKARITKDEE